MSGERLKRKLVSGMPRKVVFPSMTCPGCQETTVGRIIADVLEELEVEGRTIVVMGAGCNGVAAALFHLDVLQGAHGRPPDIATAIKRLSPGNIVFTMQGDGDCMAIGAGSLVGAMTRGEKITVIMCNNANYGTTGGQLAPTTLLGQKTTTTPDGRDADLGGYPVHAAELAATFRGVAYSARGALYNPSAYRRTRRYIKTAFQKQIDCAGLGFVEVLTTCPANWHMTPVESLKWIETEMVSEYPLGEFKSAP